MTPRIRTTDPRTETTRTGDGGGGYRGAVPRSDDRLPSVDRSEARLEELSVRLDRAEARLLVLETTLRGVARETGVSIGSQCDRCERSYLLISEGMMTCPACRYRRSI